ncbi:MAG: Jag N-terminal domain-containing protein, partial [Candidatus Binatus sp.]
MSNMDSIEVEAASVEEATMEALEQLGAREDEVAVEVLVSPRSGVLGMGARNARVRVTRKSALGAGGVANPQTAQTSSPQ